MTPRQFVEQEMDRIRELTSGLSEERYDEYLQQLILELENERQLLCWNDMDE